MLRKTFDRFYRLEQKLFGGLGLGRTVWGKKLKQWIFPRVYPEKVQVYGFNFYLDPVAGFLDPAGYKPEVGRKLQAELKPGDIAIDIGANIGLFTCLMSKLVGPKGKIYAFEPEPKNIGLLKTNLDENNFGNVVIVPKAVSDAPGSFPLVSRGAHSTFGFDYLGDTKDFISVETTRLDDYFRGSQERISLLKMDIIGADPKALRGMRELLKSNPQISLVLGFCPAYFERSGESSRTYLLELAGLGFRVWDMTRGREELIPPERFDELAERYAKFSGGHQGELFCRR